jgi:hypothetical protein
LPVPPSEVRDVQNTAFRIGPVALTTTYTTNIFNPGTTTGGVNCTGAPWDKLNVIIRKIRVVNKTASAATFRLYLGATGANTAGTELYYDFSVAANSVHEAPFYLRLSTTDFLVGGAGTTLALVFEADGEIGVGA